MIILDSLLVGGLRFVLDKIASAVETELDDEQALREELLAAQMRVELGELSEEDFAEVEAAVVGRLQEIAARRRGGAAPGVGLEPGARVVGVDVSFGGDEKP